MLKYGILGLLNYHDFTGYEIMIIFHDSLNYFWTAQTSQIYRELQTLKDKGLVNVTPVPQDGKPDKNVFSINEKGKDELLNWLSSEFNDPVRIPLLLKTFFLGERSSEENIAFFEQLKKDYTYKIEIINKSKHPPYDYEALLNDSYRAQYWKMTNIYGIMHMQMIISWCDACIEMIRGNSVG